jgi:hypothetical protein
MLTDGCRTIRGHRQKANALNTDVLRAQLLKDGAFLDEYRA